MKKLSLLLALALLLTLTACRKKEPEPSTPPEPPAPVEDVLRLEELRLEFPRSGLGKDQLAGAAKELPELLKTYFEETGTVEVERVIVTVGSSPASSAQALEEDHIDLAFLPGTTALDGPAVLLADAYPLADGTLRAGSRGLLCAAPTGGWRRRRSPPGIPPVPLDSFHQLLQARS